jgi:hypothetical protein
VPIDWDAIGAAGGLSKPQRVRRQKAGKPRKPVAKVNDERREERREVTRGPQWEACHGLNCCACGAEPNPITEAHHEPPTSRGGEDADCVPLCTPCHVRRHTIGERSFWGELDLNPEDMKDAVRAYMASPVARYRKHVPAVQHEGGDQ